MTERYIAEQVPVLIEQSEENDRLTIGTFQWEHGRPEDTYTIEIDPYTSLRLDAHFPARPDTVSLYDAGKNGSEKLLDAIIGETLTAHLLASHVIGAQVVLHSLSTQNSINIARIQRDSPNTPVILRKACRTMLEALEIDQLQQGATPKLHNHKSRREEATSGSGDGGVNLTPAA
jgi:hypothetical protein